jgi:hypothetical protein
MSLAAADGFARIQHSPPFSIQAWFKNNDPLKGVKLTFG